MEFLNKAFAQLSDLFRSMTPGARIASGLLLAVAVISLAFLFGHTSSSPDTELMSGALFARASCQRWKPRSRRPG